MFFKIKRIQSRINELAKYRYKDNISVPLFDCLVDKEYRVAEKPPLNADWQEIKVGDDWQGRDHYLWLRKEIEIPEEWEGRTILGRFDFGKTGGGNNSGFESLLFINGKPYQGVDSNHQEVFFPEGLVGKVELTFKLWSGLEGGGKPTPQQHKLKLAEIACLDQAADDLYYTAKAVLETIKVLDENSPERIELLKILDAAIREIDWSKPASDQFYNSIEESNNLLNSKLEGLEKKHPVTVTTIGHTHIDVAWLWRLKHTREKCARSFSTVLRLMEKYPEYIFLQSQPQLYEYIKEDYPDIYQQIKERVTEGKWEVEGGMWLEADCNLTSGESLVRQLLMGTRFMEREFGVKCKYLWLPDVFGYSWALPQIMKKSGIETFMTTKISWNQYNRMPHDLFNWRGIDGTELLTYFITTPDPGNSSIYYTYNGQITPETVKGIWDNYNDKNISQELLLSYGYGDGGGGVNREMLEMRRRLDKIPGLPNVKNGRAGDFFEKLHKQVEESDQYIHTWDGELYLEYHRGTYTSQADIKRANRKLELLYREAEWLSVLNSLATRDWKDYPQGELNNGWKIILRNQFHDIIPGSSINEVYEDTREEYRDAFNIGYRELNNSLNNLTKNIEYKKVNSNVEKGYYYTVFNSASWQLTGYIEIPVEEWNSKGSWVDINGEKLTAEKTNDNWIIEVKDIPSMGYTLIEFNDQNNLTNGHTTPFKVSNNGITTPFYDIEWNQEGQLVKLYDRENKREVLAADSRGNVLQVFEDKPLAHDAWDIDIFYQEKMREVSLLKKIEVETINSLFAVIYFEWEYMDSVIKQKMKLYADNPRIDFLSEIDWHEQQQLLKVAFPVDVRATEATYDIQFGNVKRPTHWNTSWDFARFETVGHQWADLSETAYGVSLLNDCKYGYDIKDNVIRLSLIKSAKHPDHKADQGMHKFTYSLLPHRGDWLKGETVKSAWELNNPLIAKVGKGKLLQSQNSNNSKEQFSLFNIDVDNVIIDVVKKAEDNNKILLRLHEYTGARCSVGIDSDLEIESWQECNLLEKPVGERVNKDKIEFRIKPYEIKTFLVDMN